MTSNISSEDDNLQPAMHVHDDLVVEPRLRALPLTLWNIPRFLLLALIRLYQAIYKYGALKGGWLAVWRILRCNPFNPGGIDPVR